MTNATVVKITSFGQALAALREERGLSHRELATRVGVGKAEIKAWERGQSYPTAFHFKKLLGSIQRLWGFASMLPHEQREEVRADRLNAAKEPGTASAFVEPEPEPPAIEEPPPPKTFGEALRSARLREGLDQHEVGEMLAVEQGTVSRWELEGNAPIADHYRKLCDLFPALVSAPKPAVREIPKPAGNQFGACRDPESSPVERAVALLPTPVAAPVVIVTPPPPAPPPDPLSLLTPAERAGVENARAMQRTAEAERVVAEKKKALKGSLIDYKNAITASERCYLSYLETARRLHEIIGGPPDVDLYRRIENQKKRLRDDFFDEMKLFTEEGFKS